MTNEVITKDGYKDVIDVDTCEVMARKIRFKAHKSCTLCGGKFSAGDVIEASFPASVDINEFGEHSGPWEFEHSLVSESGGCSSIWIRNNATEIIDSTGANIYNAPYSKTFLVSVKSETRTHLMKSIIRGFLTNRSY
ncbi:MAG: hypothetical protein AB9903_03205 [Vulcanimicrobiota bacterium]